MGSSGTQTSSTVSRPPPEVMNAYRNISDRAFAQADQPYMYYPHLDQLTQPLLNQQGQALGTIDAAQGIPSEYFDIAQQYANAGAAPIMGQIPGLTLANMNPYAAQASEYGINAGQNLSDFATAGGADLSALGRNLGSNIAGYGASAGDDLASFGRSAGQNISQTGMNFAGDIAGYGSGAADEIANYVNRMGGAAPQFEAFSPGAISQYLNPYTQNVVDATARQFAHDNDVQAQGSIGQAIRSGNAFGGDRMGVALSELAGAQKRAQDPVLAGIYERGYGQAVNQFNTGNQAAQQAYGTTVGGLTGARNLGLGAQTAAGNLGTGAVTSGANLGTQAATSGANLGLQGQTAGANLEGQLGTSGLNAATQGQSTGANLGLQGQNLGAQGYGQAQQVALTGAASDASRASNAAQQFAAMGPAEQAAMLQGAQAQFAAYDYPRQLSEQMWKNNYAGFQEARAHPYAMTQFLANTLLGTGANLGGTSTTTQPGQNNTGQYIGAGLTAASMLMGMNRGGRVRTLADGGSAGGNWLDRAPNYLGIRAPIRGGGGMGIPGAPRQGGEKGSGGGSPISDMLRLIPSTRTLQAAKSGIRNWGSMFGGGEGGREGIDPASAGSEGSVPLGLGDIDIDLSGILPMTGALGGWNLGGRVPSYAGGGMAAMADPEMGELMQHVATAADTFRGMRRSMGGVVQMAGAPQGYDEGGGVYDPFAPFEDRWSDAYQPTNVDNVDIVAPDQFNRIDAMADAPMGFDERFPDMEPARQMTLPERDDYVSKHGFPSFSHPDGPAPMADVPLPLPAPRQTADMPPVFRTLGDPEPEVPAYDAERPRGGLQVQNRQIEPQRTLGSEGAGTPADGEAPNKFDQFVNSPWYALMMTGLGMMSSKSPTILGQLGEGSLVGLSSYQAARKMTQEAARIKAQMARDERRQDETERHNRKTENYREKSHEETVTERRERNTRASEDRRLRLRAMDRPGTGPDPEDPNKQVPGTYMFNPETGGWDFNPNMRQTGRTQRTTTPIEIEREARLQATKDTGDPKSIKWERNPAGYAAEFQKNLEKRRQDLQQRYGLPPTPAPISPNMAPSGPAPGPAPKPEAPAAPTSSLGQPKRVASKAEYDALRSGEQYVAPDGTIRTKR